MSVSRGGGGGGGEEGRREGGKGGKGRQEGVSMVQWSHVIANSVGPCKRVCCNWSSY